jgi:AcrR family transcriptional regulator
MSDLSIKRLRTMGYFITAADEIIQEEGIDKATIRNIAKKAGYNSATIYNYFNDLEHLIFFTKISHLEVYKARLYNEIPDDLDPLEELIKVFRIFAEETFKNPYDFYDLFFSK